jgi:hypothetical protein
MQHALEVLKFISKFWLENLKGNAHTRDLDVDAMILEKYGAMCVLDLTEARWYLLEGFCEYREKSSDSIRAANFLTSHV